MKKQEAVAIGASVAVGVTFCEADFDTREEWEQFLKSLTQPIGRKLLIDNLDLDDVKDNLAQASGLISIEEFKTER